MQTTFLIDVPSFPSVTGSPANGSPISASSIAVQSLERTGEILIFSSTRVKDDKDLAGDSAGDTIDYAILLENNGTTTLSAISVSSTQLLAQFERNQTYVAPTVTSTNAVCTW